MLTRHDCARIELFLFGMSEDGTRYKLKFPSIACEYGHYKSCSEVLMTTDGPTTCHVPMCDGAVDGPFYIKMRASKFWPDVKLAYEDACRI